VRLREGRGRWRSKGRGSERERERERGGERERERKKSYPRGSWSQKRGRIDIRMHEEACAW